MGVAAAAGAGGGGRRTSSSRIVVIILTIIIRLVLVRGAEGVESSRGNDNDKQVENQNMCFFHSLQTLDPRPYYQTPGP